MRRLLLLGSFKNPVLFLGLNQQPTEQRLLNNRVASPLASILHIVLYNQRDVNTFRPCWLCLGCEYVLQAAREAHLGHMLNTCFTLSQLLSSVFVPYQCERKRERERDLDLWNRQKKKKVINERGQRATGTVFICMTSN